VGSGLTGLEMEEESLRIDQQNWNRVSRMGGDFRRKVVHLQVDPATI
jgi:hypothetical protein